MARGSIAIETDKAAAARKFLRLLLVAGAALICLICLGIITAEGQRAVMRIDNRQGQTIWVSYRVYNSNP